MSEVDEAKSPALKLYDEARAKEIYRTRQAKQLAFLERIEPYERFNPMPSYGVSCATCKVPPRKMRSADGARSFIMNHKDHETTLNYGGRIV